MRPSGNTLTWTFSTDPATSVALSSIHAYPVDTHTHNTYI